MPRAKVGDLFCCMGGSSQGAVQAGCQVDLAVDLEPSVLSVHQANHPEALHLAEDLSAPSDTLKQALGDLDLDGLLISPPCPGHARSRGAEQPEHGSSRSLTWSVVWALQQARPSFFVVENVVGLLKWEELTAWRKAIEDLGYGVSFEVVRAQDLGLPQRRERLFVVGELGSSPKLELAHVPHVAADTVIDWDEPRRWNPVDNAFRGPGTGIKSLSQQSLRRIAHGRKVYGDRFYYNTNKGNSTARDLSRPLWTVSCVERFVLVSEQGTRAFTVPEYLVFMGFPSAYITPSRKQKALHGLGNAVSPLVEQALLDELLGGGGSP